MARQNPKGSSLPGRLGHEPGGHRGDGRRPGQTLAPASQPVGHQVLLHGRLGDGRTPGRRGGRRTGEQPMVGSTTARVNRARPPRGWAWRWASAACAVPWASRRLEAVALGHVLPLVVPGPRHAEDPTGLGHVAGPLGMLQHGTRRWKMISAGVTVMGSLALWMEPQSPSPDPTSGWMCNLERSMAGSAGLGLRGLVALVPVTHRPTSRLEYRRGIGTAPHQVEDPRSP